MTPRKTTVTKIYLLRIKNIRLIEFGWLSKVPLTSNSFQLTVTLRTETSNLICTANCMIGFFIRHNSGLKWVTNDQ